MATPPGALNRIRHWRATGTSINGQLVYEIQLEAVLSTTAREMLRECVVDHVRKHYGATPRGVPWLVDPRTICVEEIDTDTTADTKEGTP